MLLGIARGAARGRASRITRSDLLSDTRRSNGICNLSLLFFVHLLLEELKTLTDIILIKWIILLYYTNTSSRSRLPLIVDVVFRIVKHFPYVFVILLLAGSLVDS